MKQAESQNAGKIIRDAAGPAGKKAEKSLTKQSTMRPPRRNLPARVCAQHARRRRDGRAMKAKEWVKENPAKPCGSFSLVLGIRMGASFPGIDAC